MADFVLSFFLGIYATKIIKHFMTFAVYLLLRHILYCTKISQAAMLFARLFVRGNYEPKKCSLCIVCAPFSPICGIKIIKNWPRSASVLIEYKVIIIIIIIIFI